MSAAKRAPRTDGWRALGVRSVLSRLLELEV